VVAAITDEEWEDLLTTAIAIPSGIVCDQVAPCDGFIDLKFDAMWADILNGTLTPGVGLVSAFDGANYYASLALVYEDCPGTDFTVQWWNNGHGSLSLVWGQQTWNGSSWVGAISTVLPDAVSGTNIGVISAGGSGLRRLVMFTQSSSDPAHVNRIETVEWEPQ
jgi:hypothetical protein